MWYAILGNDRAGSLDQRRAQRPAHLARLDALRDAGRLLLAGPLPAIDSAEPGPAGFSGSLVVAEFESLEAAESWARADPYVAAGGLAESRCPTFPAGLLTGRPDCATIFPGSGDPRGKIQMIRIVIADDHELVRTGFRMILARESDLDIVGEAASGEEAVALVRRLQPDVVLMDVQLPGISGLEATERIGRGGSGARVIVVTVLDEQPFPRRLIEAGASGYLSKACPAQELIDAVRTVARGGRYIGIAIAQAMALASMPGCAVASPFENLSARELEVALKLAAGESMQHIAGRLHLSPKTVATYKYRVFEKLGVENEVALAHLAGQHGLLESGGLRRA